MNSSFDEEVKFSIVRGTWRITLMYKIRKLHHTRLVWFVGSTSLGFYPTPLSEMSDKIVWNRTLEDCHTLERLVCIHIYGVYMDRQAEGSGATVSWLETTAKLLPENEYQDGLLDMPMGLMLVLQAIQLERFLRPAFL